MSSFYYLLRYNTADGKAVGVAAVVHRAYVGIVEVQAVPEGTTVRSRRPVVTVGTLIVHGASEVVPVTRSR